MLELIKTFYVNNCRSIIVGVICLLLGAILTALVCSSKAKVENKNQKRSFFSKIAIFVLFFIMTIFVLVSFFGHSNGFMISNEIVYILGLMIFLLISDSIETFSIGNLITLSKKVKTKEKEIEKLSIENTQLRTQVVSIATASITNTNHNQVILDLNKALKGVDVEGAVEGDRDEEEIIQDTVINTAPTADQNHTYSSGYYRSLFAHAIEKRIVEKFAIKNEIDINAIQMRVKFSEQFTYGNPIMESKLVYDAYLKRPLEELFIEFAHLSASIATNYRLYYMISMVVNYAQINNRSAKLILLIPNYPLEWAEKILPHRNQQRDLERLQNTFQPAIKNGFLEIKVMNFSETECQEIESEIKKKEENIFRNQ